MAGSPAEAQTLILPFKGVTQIKELGNKFFAVHDVVELGSWAGGESSKEGPGIVDQYVFSCDTLMSIQQNTQKEADPNVPYFFSPSFPQAAEECRKVSNSNV